MTVSIRDKISLFLNSPLEALSLVGRGLLCKIKVPAQVVELREITRREPLFLQIETINTCNASCIFCPYSGMKRKKGVMSLSLFRKIVREYTEMGGGSVCLTPIAGDALLDPHFLERLNILKEHPEIKQITLTTNGIALERYSDQEIRCILENLYCLQVSIGGLEAATYKTMYGVDRFFQVQQGMERLLNLRKDVPSPAQISFAFRTNDSKFETRFKSQLDHYREKGAYISHMWTYANFFEAVKDNKEEKLVVYDSRGKKRLTCVTPRMNITVCWDGNITACGCADFEGDKLRVGNAEQETIVAVWSGEKRAAVIDSFAKGKLFPICRKCSGYTPDTFFARPCFKGIKRKQPLPLDFYRNVVT